MQGKGGGEGSHLPYTQFNTIDWTKLLVQFVLSVLSELTGVWL